MTDISLNRLEDRLAQIKNDIRRDTEGKSLYSSFSSTFAVIGAVACVAVAVLKAPVFILAGAFSAAGFFASRFLRSRCEDRLRQQAQSLEDLTLARNVALRGAALDAAPQMQATPKESAALDRTERLENAFDGLKQEVNDLKQSVEGAPAPLDKPKFSVRHSPEL